MSSKRKCCVVGCVVKDSEPASSFYSIPTVRKNGNIKHLMTQITTKRRAAWIQVLNVIGEPSTKHMVCSLHFISGKKSLQN